MKMSVKCDKMLLIPPSTNHWPQSEEKASGGSITEKQASSGKQEAEKCPRCESSNTKFCYYNNYSLSQPRYFCKACKRYWTKGGTLRNVPVGGGCRKNKRATPLKRSSSDPIHSSAPPPPPHMFYGFPNNNSCSGMNLPLLYPAKFNCNTSSGGCGFDLEPGSAFSSVVNGFDSSSLLMSRERNTSISTNFEGLLLHVDQENMQMGSDHEEVVVASKDVKSQLEEHHVATLYDPSSSLYYWSNNNMLPMVGGVWNNDATSAPSLI